MKAVHDTGSVVSEPSWPMLLTDELEIAAAAEHWRIVTTEMRSRSTLSPVNRHAIQRLVLSYIVSDRAAREVLENGAVTKPRRGNSKAIARLSPHFIAMREAASDAATLEAELGLAPRRRSVGKVEGAKKASRAADAYLKSVS